MHSFVKPRYFQMTKFVIFGLKPNENLLSKNNLDIDRGHIILLKEGNRKAFKLIFNRYNQRLYFFALGYLKSEDDAEEIVQDTFLKLWERRSNIDPELSFHSYLFMIAFNNIQKRLKKNLKEQTLKHNLASELVTFDNQTSNTIDYGFLLQYVGQLIEKLPPRQREIIQMRKLRGYSIKEISEDLSLSKKTVEAHLTAGLKFLKQKMQSERFDDLLLFILTFRKKNHLD